MMFRYLQSMMREQPLARDSVAVFAAIVAGSAASFAVQVLLARLAGPEQFGTYSLVLTWAIMLALLAEFGSDQQFCGLLRSMPKWGITSISAVSCGSGRKLPWAGD